MASCVGSAAAVLTVAGFAGPVAGTLAAADLTTVAGLSMTVGLTITAGLTTAALTGLAGVAGFTGFAAIVEVGLVAFFTGFILINLVVEF